MQKITPYLWFDKEAEEAAKLYESVFPGAHVLHTTELQDTPSGSAKIIQMNIMGVDFALMNAGPEFKFNPSISFMVMYRSPDEVDAAYRQLSEGGQVMMEVGSYPFSPRYAWVADKFGVPWQLMCVESMAPLEERLVPSFLFVGDVCGRAEEAVQYWTSVFPHSEVGTATRYGEGEAPDKPGTVKHISFRLNGQGFSAMDSAYDHKFAFSEAISLSINCETQEEVDFFWEKLSAHPEAEQCGWVKDKFGVSWQVTPIVLGEMIADKDTEKANRVVQAMLKMKKIDIAELKRAYSDS